MAKLVLKNLKLLIKLFFSKNFLGKVVLLWFFFLPLQAEKADIIGNFLFDKDDLKIVQEKINYQIRWDQISILEYVKTIYTPSVKKTLFMNDCALKSFLRLVPKEKKILFLWEAKGASSDYCSCFSRIYTINDDLVDNVFYFKFFYPVLKPMISNLIDFNEKKFSLLVSHHLTPEREKVIRFFETKPEEDFDFFGYKKVMESTRYRGKVPGNDLNLEKFSFLNQYKFCICFENTLLNGYITEKIFSCFAAGCVPVYFGAPNVEEYIPKECFIDYRDFKNDEELYQFLKSMTKETYDKYIENIQNYLKSEKAKLFSLENFAKIIEEAIEAP